MRSLVQPVPARVTALAAVALFLSACSADPAPVTVQSVEDSTSAFANATVSITSTDGVMRLAVVGDSVVMALSDSLRRSVTDKMESGDSGRSGLGRAIVGVVGAAVNKALGVAITVPATDLRELRYENGELRFDLQSGNLQVNARDADGKLQQGSGGAFREADALEFIEAVRAVQERVKGQ
jgi:PBP1b-binding outer membrane lipoprotein LpoB